MMGLERTAWLLTVLVVLDTGSVLSQDDASAVEGLKSLEGRDTPMRSRSDETPQSFRIPAPRGLIVDRNGAPIALSRAASYVGLRLQAYKKKDDLEGALKAIEEIQKANPDAPWSSLKRSEIMQHWENRPHLPFPMTSPMSEEETNSIAAYVDSHPHLGLEIRWEREYPMGEVAGHISGYARIMRPMQHGPLSVPEEMFPAMEGAEAFEKSMDEVLSGQDGLASYIYSDQGEVIEVEILEPVIPGNTVVTTLNGEMQRLAYKILKENGKPGALVAVDALSGDILALASYPSFDPNEFTNGISDADYAVLRDDPMRPLFPRATMGAYPAGSTFKPFVALAAMSRGIVSGKMTMFESLPYVEVDGRAFHNWSTNNEGFIDVRYALLRSSNTWFYQVGVLTGGDAILDTARKFGFGKAPDIALTVSAGNLPTLKEATANQAVANLSIGQGKVLVTPLQLANSMAGLSVGTYVPEPRLVLQTQDANNDILDTTAKRRIASLNSHRLDRFLIREGMWGVVNHERGTAKVAAHKSPEVYGKTGTAQRILNGNRTNVAWFSGYVGSNSPRLAFASMVEGEAGETLSGGRNAAPLIAAFVKKVYAEPEHFDVNVTVTAPPQFFMDEATIGIHGIKVGQDGKIITAPAVPAVQAVPVSPILTR